MSQQKQTLDYFKSHAENWNKKAVDEEYNLIENRHNAVLEVMKHYGNNSSILDVGCGTGQLAIEASKLGWKSIGIDFAKEMIDICKQNNINSNTKADFVCNSIFEAELDKNTFDIVSAQGFIEYISLEQLSTFLDLTYDCLKDSGSIALGSRNRLFNLHTLNSFTELEVSLGTISKLINEGIILQSSNTQDEAIKLLTELNYDYEQPTEHPLTGVKVDTRYQFSPADLITKLATHGFKVNNIYPVHFHPLPVTMLENKLPGEIHKQLAKLASTTWISNHKITPYSSSFVIEAIKL
jgi:2-polyprenyl-3-methyl-5-hydroxy-6-metoxy-1,4-benzoquinol methylase